MFYLERVIGLRANRLADSVAMLRSPLEGAQDKHVQRPLHQFNTILIGFVFGHPYSRQSTRMEPALEDSLLVLGPAAADLAFPEFLFRFVRQF